MILPDDFKLLPGMNDIHELNMALSEKEAIKDIEKLRKRTAYYSHIEDQETDIYQICSQGYLELGNNSSRQEFFKSFAFKTGYASHGLFPYRGKFHPQLVRGLINIMKIPENGSILDPMGGSGTTAVEANIMNINAVSIDVSPFCTFMMKVKTNVLNISRTEINQFQELYSEFNKKDDIVFETSIELEKNIQGSKMVLDLFKLAYIDTIGYRKRRKTGTFSSLLNSVCNRYFGTISRFVSVRDDLNLQIGNSSIIQDDAKNLNLPKKSYDAIITSPPYSFAIDYVKGDEQNLGFMGIDPKSLYDSMIGLRGRLKKEKLANYFTDMKLIIERMHQVLKDEGKVCMVVGDNTNQTGGLKISDEITKIFKAQGFNQTNKIIRPIKGIRNLMREELILIYQVD